MNDGKSKMDKTIHAAMKPFVDPPRSGSELVARLCKLREVERFGSAISTAAEQEELIKAWEWEQAK